MKHLLLITAITLMFSNLSFANKRCGLGSKFFGKSKGIVSQLSEITTNQASSENNSISSGTSGCKHNGTLINQSLGKNDRFEEAKEEQDSYANVNFEELKMEMAMGKGEVLSGFANSFGCAKSSQLEFIKMTHDSFSEIVPSQNTTPNEMVNKVREIIKINTNLKTNCWLS